MGKVMYNLFGCDHKVVLEIYTDSTHLKISHYRCPKCWEKREEQFGEKIISQLKMDIVNNL